MILERERCLEAGQYLALFFFCAFAKYISGIVSEVYFWELGFRGFPFKDIFCQIPITVHFSLEFLFRVDRLDRYLFDDGDELVEEVFFSDILFLTGKISRPGAVIVDIAKYLSVLESFEFFFGRHA